MPRPAKPFLHRNWRVTDVGGRRTKLAHGWENRKQAEQAFHELLTKASYAPEGKSVQQVAVWELADQFLDWVRIHRSEKTFADYHDWLMGPAYRQTNLALIGTSEAVALWADHFVADKADHAGESYLLTGEPFLVEESRPTVHPFPRLLDALVDRRKHTAVVAIASRLVAKGLLHSHPLADRLDVLADMLVGGVEGDPAGRLLRQASPGGSGVPSGGAQRPDPLQDAPDPRLVVGARERDFRGERGLICERDLALPVVTLRVPGRALLPRSGQVHLKEPRQPLPDLFPVGAPVSRRRDEHDESLARQ